MPMLGLVFSDPGWYQWPHEQLFFDVQHFMMLAAPWYYLFTKRYDIDSVNKTGLFFVSLGVALYYCILLVWVSYYYQEDFSGTRCRLDAFEFLGTWWRELESLACFIMSFVFGPLPQLFFNAVSPYKSVNIKNN
eukprot:TRINITY_DN1863_c0_g1_i3.p1 TRINITY_DN1863_c0_g1~~TRINITY_DN1863_c0_g1_i3.p1  ORF type:complete len:134 (-),score=12.93 TRINITY_DN1863_c0_g1_i3:23-424(-)